MDKIAYSKINLRIKHNPAFITFFDSRHLIPDFFQRLDLTFTNDLFTPHYFHLRTFSDGTIKYFTTGNSLSFTKRKLGNDLGCAKNFFQGTYF